MNRRPWPLSGRPPHDPSKSFDADHGGPARCNHGVRCMKRLRSTPVALCLILVLGAAPGALAQPAPRSGTAMPKSALEDPIVNEGVIEDGAVDAIKEMSKFLMTAKTLALTSQGSLDVVTNDGQRIQLDGTTNYKIRRPAFVIDYESETHR